MVKYIKKVNDGNYFIFLNFKKDSYWFSIKNLYRPSLLQHISKKELKKTILKKKEIFILSNSSGISLNQNNVPSGGILIAKLSLNN